MFSNQSLMFNFLDRMSIQKVKLLDNYYTQALNNDFQYVYLLTSNTTRFGPHAFATENEAWMYWANLSLTHNGKKIYPVYRNDADATRPGFYTAPGIRA